MSDVASVINPAHWTQDIRHEHTCRGVKSSPAPRPAVQSASSAGIEWESILCCRLLFLLLLLKRHLSIWTHKIPTIPFIHKNPTLSTFILLSKQRLTTCLVFLAILVCCFSRIILILLDNWPKKAKCSNVTFLHKTMGLIKKKKHFFYSNCPKHERVMSGFGVSPSKWKRKDFFLQLPCYTGVEQQYRKISKAEEARFNWLECTAAVKHGSCVPMQY